MGGKNQETNKNTAAPKKPSDRWFVLPNLLKYC